MFEYIQWVNQLKTILLWLLKKRCFTTQSLSHGGRSTSLPIFNAFPNFVYPVQMHHTTGVLEPRSPLVLQIPNGVGTVLFKKKKKNLSRFCHVQ